MISWSEKKELDTACDRVRDADDGEEAIEELVEYIGLAHDIPETKRVLKKRLRNASSLHSYMRVVRLVFAGADERNKELRELLGNSMIRRRLCRVIASQVSTELSLVEVEANRPVLVFDKIKYQLVSKDDKNTLVDFSNGGKETKQFKIVRSLKVSNGAMSAAAIADKIGGTSENVRRSIPDINRKFHHFFETDLICQTEGISRTKHYKLNPDYCYQ